MRFSQTNLSSKKTLDRLDRDVFEAKLWLERTCRRGAHQNRAIAPSRCDPTSSIVYSCCNRAPGIFPHSYGNVLGLIERNQLGFGIYLLQVSVLQWKNQLATLNHIVVPMTSISHLIEPKTYYDPDPTPQTWLSSHHKSRKKSSQLEMGLRWVLCLQAKATIKLLRVWWFAKKRDGWGQKRSKI